MKVNLKSNKRPSLDIGDVVIYSNGEHCQFFEDVFLNEFRIREVNLHTGKIVNGYRSWNDIFKNKKHIEEIIKFSELQLTKIDSEEDKNV